jgi:putative exosortase-associated protein (TIGR04073 family)
MARRIAVFGIIILFAVILSTPAYCDTWVKKFSRGVCNMLTAPVEIPAQMRTVGNAEGPTVGVTYGLLKGVGVCIKRELVGIYEVVTFPFPIPRNYAPIMTDPEFMLSDITF